MKRLIVVSVGVPKPSKYNEFSNRFVTLKSIDPTDKTKYKGNIDWKYPARANINDNLLKVGNVVDCQMQENKVNINMFEPIVLVKKAEKGTSNGRKQSVSK